MIDPDQFAEIVRRLTDAGYADDDIAWAESIKEPVDAEDFALETVFVICNSGMRFTVARGIYDRVRERLLEGGSAGDVFGHKGKTAAIDKIWTERERLFTDYKAAVDKLAWLAALPWIGDITKFHLAKNFGLDVVKPDVHMTRLALAHATTPEDLCREIADRTGMRIATIDTLLWRACATGVLSSRTGALIAAPAHPA